MDHDHISLELAPIATIDDLRSDQHDICPSLLRAFYVARYLPWEGTKQRAISQIGSYMILVVDAAYLSEGRTLGPRSYYLRVRARSTWHMCTTGILMER